MDKRLQTFLASKSGKGKEGKVWGGGATLSLTLTLTGVAEGDTEGAEEVGVATDERFLPLATKDFRCLHRKFSHNKRACLPSVDLSF